MAPIITAADSFHPAFPVSPLPSNLPLVEQVFKCTLRDPPGCIGHSCHSQAHAGDPVPEGSQALNLHKDRL